MSNFDEYKRLGEPEKYEKAENWQIAVGLQQVDGLEPSNYLIELAKKNIEGELTIDEVKESLNSYYKESAQHTDNIERKDIPLHITRFFPNYLYDNKSPTPISTIRKLARIARSNLDYVYCGNC